MSQNTQVRSFKSVVKYVGPYPWSFKRVVKCVGPYALSFKNVVKHDWKFKKTGIQKTAAPVDIVLFQNR